MKRNRFLIGMASAALVLVMAGCDSIATGAKKIAEGMSSYTIVLANVANGDTYTAVVYDSGEATGGGVAEAVNGSASIRLTPYNGKPAFSERTYRVQVISAGTVKEAASVAFVASGNTPLDWGTMTVISEGQDDENAPNPPESKTYTSGNVTLTLTEIQSSASHVLFSISSPEAGEKFYYVLYIDGQKTSGGTVTIGAARWTFVPDTDGGKTFYAEVSGDSLIFADEIADAGELPITADGEDDGEEEDGTQASYGISLSKSGTHVFPAVSGEDYEAPEALKVTITNTGNQPTGKLTVTLSNNAAFTIAPSTISSITADGSDSFAVTPKTGLAEGTYTATVRVSGGNDISEGFGVNWTVNPPATTPVYGIALSESDAYIFPSATAGYGAQTAKSVTITNTGNQPTGNLTLALSSSSAFTLSATSIGSIAAGDSNSFTVTPKTGLAAGTHTATVTVSGGNGIFAGFNVSFTVNPPAVTSVYDITLSETGTYTFPAATAGYSAQTAKSVTITNTGNQATGNLTLALSSSSAFTLSATSVSSIAASGSNSFTVTPKTGKSAGTYTAAVTVSGSNITSKSFNVSFTVNPPAVTSVYDITLSETGTYTFPAATAGYSAQTAKSITITNTGNQSTGNLTLALSSSSAFTLSATSMGSIAASGSNSFTVTPKTGKSAGTYTAAVTVSGSNITSKSFNVSFTVNPPAVTPSYGITLSETGTYIFPKANPGYGTQTSKNITVTNTSTTPTGNLNVSLSGAGSAAFALAPSTINSIAAGGTGTFHIFPNTGRAIGVYTATVTVSGGNGITASFNVSFTVASYGISLDFTGTHTFPAADPGYGTQTPKSVTITNTGNQPTGNLTVALSNNAAFTIAPSTINSIAAGASDTFYVFPNTGLAIGIRTATVTVSGGSNITSKSFSVSFTVASYGISLSSYASSAFTGYDGAQTGPRVTIGNTGNQPTGNLTLALSSASAFTLSTTTISSIAAGGTATFRVVPNTGLSAGTYTVNVTVSGSSKITAKSVSVSFTVVSRTYGISLNSDTRVTYLGYGTQIPISVYVTNTGNQPTGNLTLALSDDSVFTLSSTAVNSIETAGPYNSSTNSFTITPKTGLAAGTHTAMVTVSGGNGISASLNVSFTVEDPALGFSSYSVARAYLEAQSGGGSASAPIPLKMNVNLSSATDGWVALVNALASKSKYVALDLSLCSMSGTEFDLYAGAVAGKNYIASLILPDSITSITRSAGATPQNLKTISGVNVTSIGANTFKSCSALTTASFPKATSIGTYAFSGCTALTTVSLPNVTYIGTYAFSGCTALTTVSFPEATTIGSSAFSGCTALTTVSFPEATTIGSSAFSGCTALTTVSFPEATTIGYEAFYGCAALTTVSTPNVTSITTSNLFSNSGRGALTITMGAAAPTLVSGLNGAFQYTNGLRTVTIRVPGGATGYDATWQTVFKGGNSYINENSYINLVFEYY